MPKRFVVKHDVVSQGPEVREWVLKRAIDTILDMKPNDGDYSQYDIDDAKELLFLLGIGVEKTKE